MPKPVVCVDFDGTITRAHGFGEPMPGAIEWLNGAIEWADLVIFTVRGNRSWERKEIRDWLRGKGFVGADDVLVTHEKVPAFVYIDDRGWRFEGHWPSREELFGAEDSGRSRGGC